MYIGPEYRRFYDDPSLADQIGTEWLPWLLDGRGPAGDPPVDLGAEVLDLGAGRATRIPSDRVDGRLTVVEPDRCDPATLPWPDDTFTTVLAVLVLQHLPTSDDQDAALAEWARVLRPGGTLVGLVPIEGPHFHRLDPEGRCCPVDPMTLPARLSGAGFPGARVRVWSLVGFVGSPGPAAPGRGAAGR